MNHLDDKRGRNEKSVHELEELLVKTYTAEFTTLFTLTNFESSIYLLALTDQNQGDHRLDLTVHNVDTRYLDTRVNKL